MNKSMILIATVVSLSASTQIDAISADDMNLDKIAFISKRHDGEILTVIDPSTKEEQVLTLPQSNAVGFPQWSPRCDRIALDRFEGEQKVVSIAGYDANGISNDVSPVSPVELLAYTPRWSPDGHWLAFQGLDTAHPEGNFEIYTLFTTTGETINLTNDPVQDVYPDWSPDGQQIVFSMIPKDSLNEYFDVYIASAKESSVKPIYVEPETDDIAPLWSPDGSSIAFLSRNKDGDRLLLIQADGSIIPLIDTPAYNIRHFSWSNDSQYIAFSSGSGGDETQLYLLDVNAQSIELITNVPNSVNMYATWSPANTKIAFESDRDGDFEIYTLDLTTTVIEQLTDNEYDDVYPSWSPETCFDSMLTSDR